MRRKATRLFCDHLAPERSLSVVETSFVLGGATLIRCRRKLSWPRALVGPSCYLSFLSPPGLWTGVFRILAFGPWTLNSAPVRVSFASDAARQNCKVFKMVPNWLSLNELLLASRNVRGCPNFIPWRKLVMLQNFTSEIGVGSLHKDPEVARQDSHI